MVEAFPGRGAAEHLGEAGPQISFLERLYIPGNLMKRPLLSRHRWADFIGLTVDNCCSTLTSIQRFNFTTSFSLSKRKRPHPFVPHWFDLQSRAEGNTMQNPSFREGSRSVLSPSHPERLDTWKEIASFFRREVRTVQLWEKHEDLPVHRQQHRKLGSIYAFRSELQAWWVARSAMSDARGSVDPILPEGSMPVGSCEPRFHMNAIEIAGPPDLAVPCRPDEPLDETHVDERERLARYACSMGTHYWKDRSRRAIQKAFRYFRDAVELNPTCAEAYAGLANVYISLSYNYMMPARDAGAKAHNAVQKALELDRTSTVVRNAAVNLLMNCVWDWAAAERECRDMFDAVRSIRGRFSCMRTC